MSSIGPGGEGFDRHLEREVRRAREEELERVPDAHATEHPDPPADDPRTRGVLARVRELLGGRRARRRA